MRILYPDFANCYEFFYHNRHFLNANNGTIQPIYNSKAVKNLNVIKLNKS